MRPSTIAFLVSSLIAGPSEALINSPVSPTPSVTILKRSPTDTSNSITAKPTLSCWNQDQDPGLGFLSAFCICTDANGEVSLPEITPTPDFNNRLSSCAYKTIPVSGYLLTTMAFVVDIVASLARRVLPLAVCNGNAQLRRIVNLERLRRQLPQK